MRLMRAVSLTLLAALLAVPTVAVAQTDDVASKLPEDTVFLVTAPDLKRSWGQFKESAAWAIWQEPSVQAFYKKVRGLVEKQADQSTGGELEKMRAQFKEKTGIELDALPDVLLKGRFTMAVTHFEIDASGQNPPKVDLMVSMDYDPADERFAKLYDFGMAQMKEQAEKAGGPAKFETVKVGEVDVTKITAPDMPPTIAICIARAKNRAYVTSNLELMKSLLATGSTEVTKTLATNPHYVNARKGIDGTKEVGFSFINVEAIFAKTKAMIPEETAKTMDTAGVFGIKALAASVAIEGKELVDRYYLAMPKAERKGICKLFDYPKTAMKALRYAPADAASFSSSGFDVKAIADEALSVFKKLAPPAQVEEFETQKAQMEEQLKVKVDDLLASLGTEFTAFARLPKAGGETAPKMDDLMRATYVISLKDPATFEKGLNAILELAKVQPKQATHHGMKIHTVPFPEQGAAAPGMPTIKDIGFAIHDGLLFVAMPAADLKQLAQDAAAGAPALTGNETFRAQLARYPEGFASFVYTDIGTYVSTLWAVAKPFVMEQLKEGAPIAPEDLPNFEAIAKHLTPMTQAIYNEDGGVRAIFRSPVGSMSMVAGVGVGAAVAIPGIQASQNRAKQAGCKAQLKMIGTAVLAYKADKGKYPEELADLTTGDKKYMAGPRPFVSPADDFPMKDGGVESSYIFIYANALGDANAATTIVAYNRSPIHQGKRHVLYLDGSVKLVADADFRTEFDKQKAELKKHGIQVFMGWGKTK